MALKLITSAAYVDPELAAEFGRLPPAFLPVGHGRLSAISKPTIGLDAAFEHSALLMISTSHSKSSENPATRPRKLLLKHNGSKTSHGMRIL